MGRPPDRRDGPTAIGQAQRRTTTHEQTAQSLREPRPVARFDGDANRCRERLERLVESVKIRLEVGRQLEQDRSKMRTELPGALHQVCHRVARLAQPPDMSQVPAGLDGELEAGWDAGRPATERGRTRHAIERHIQFDRVEPGGEVLQLTVPGGRRVEPSAPVLVEKARRSDPDGRGLLLVAD